MAKAAWATNQELLSLLQAGGMIDDPPSAQQQKLDLSSALDAAVEWWERATGYKPFLADVNDSSRSFDMDGTGSIDFNGGLVSYTSMSVNGSPYTLNQQFRLEPVNAANNGRPYTGVRFMSRPYFQWGWNPSAGPGIVSITGKWGFATQIPGDVWNAVLRKAALEVLPMLTALRTGGLKRRQFADQQEEFALGQSGSVFAGEASTWEASIKQTLARYRRVRIA